MTHWGVNSKMTTGKRLQILVLVGLTVAVFVRLLSGPPAPRGGITLKNINVRSLEHITFEAVEATPVAITATGSSSGGDHLAAYAWIQREDIPATVWSMDAQTVTRDKETLVHVEHDTLTLNPGRYTLYFSSLGQVLNRRDSPFRRDRRHWAATVRPVRRDQALRLAPYAPDIESAESIWAATKLGRNEHLEHIFEVHRPATLSVHAIGQVSAATRTVPADYSQITEAASGQPVWHLHWENTQWAGGVPDNREFTGQVELVPGVYRAEVHTDRSHDFDGWSGNPPRMPKAWGLRLATPDQENVTAFDPWTSRRPIAAMVEVEDDEKRVQAFEVTRPLDVVIQATGEMTAPGNGYDLAWLDRLHPRPEPVWRMRYEETTHAGGSRKNRTETVFLTLEPARYVLHYKTDGSHAFGDWNAEPPSFPGRWGVAMFALDEASLAEDVVLTESPVPAGAGVESGSSMIRRRLRSDGRSASGAQDAPPGVLIDWTGLQANFEAEQEFTLDERSTVLIEALGEIYEGDERYDYGSIVRLDDSAVVWEMAYANTHPVGGRDGNRGFFGVVVLSPGTYAVRYETDASHHFGDFDGNEPENPELWGIRLSLVR